jgi:hypothetical protein
MSAIFVAFADSAEAVISAYFPCEQSKYFWPNQGVVDDTDARWTAYLEMLPPTVRSSLPGAVPDLTADQLLSAAQAAQSAAIDSSYAKAVQQSVSFKTADGVTQTFQSDTESQTVLMQAVQGYTMAGSVPVGFYWKCADNTLVPFSLADLEGLYGTILAQGWAAFQKRTTLKSQINAATTVDAVQAIIWS